MECDYRRGLGLVIGFIAYLYTQLLTTSDYSAIANSLQHARRLLSLLYLHRLSPGNGFQRRSFLSFHVHVLTGRRPSHNSLLQLTPRLAAISHQLPTLLTAVSTLSSKGSWPSLYSLGTDRKENTASSSSIAACVLYGHYLASANIYRDLT
jgi:hypothetical protein